MENKNKILIVEDEEAILELIEYNLKKNNYNTMGIPSGEEALKVIYKALPSLILLDLMLPGMDGIELCRALKGNLKTKDIPIIMVTAKGEEDDIVQGLEAGADDYITKPFSPKVLIARVQTVLRRHSSQTSTTEDILNFGDLYIHPGKYLAKVKDSEINLTRSEFQILHFLARKPGWVFTRYQIVDEVKGDNYIVTDRAIDVTIVGLRKKLGEAAYYIETIRGIGYRFKE